MTNEEQLAFEYGKSFDASKVPDGYQVACCFDERMKGLISNAKSKSSQMRNHRNMEAWYKGFESQKEQQKKHILIDGKKLEVIYCEDRITTATPEKIQPEFMAGNRLVFKGICPHCKGKKNSLSDKTAFVFSYQTRCDKCGQPLDWEGVNDEL